MSDYTAWYVDAENRKVIGLPVILHDVNFACVIATDGQLKRCDNLLLYADRLVRFVGVYAGENRPTSIALEETFNRWRKK